MLHESPLCNGIVHDDEANSAFGAAYFAMDGLAQHIVRLDFQQPHGPSFMDHSIANVRRFVEANFTRSRQQQASGVHGGVSLFSAERTQTAVAVVALCNILIFVVLPMHRC